MNREKFKELLPCITAFANGETLQIRNAAGDWVDFADTVAFTLDASFYRVKPVSVTVKRWIIVTLKGAMPMTENGCVLVFDNKERAEYRRSCALDTEKWVVVEMTGSYER